MYNEYVPFSELISSDSLIVKPLFLSTLYQIYKLKKIASKLILRSLISVLEKFPEAALDVDQTIFVVVAEDVERSKTTVLWAARNFSSKKICLLYVHRPARPASCSENLLLLFLFDLTVLW
ncbi:hypothetical protein YC2023_046146 [Brassica napus]